MRLFLFVFLIFFSVSIYAEIYRYVSANGVVTFTERKPPRGTTYKKINPHCVGKFATCKKVIVSDFNWNKAPLELAAFHHEIKTATQQYKVDEAFVRAVIHAESSYNPRAVSVSGAQGLMQLMPATQKIYQVQDPFNPAQNIRAGVKHLAKLLSMFDHDYHLATAAYHAGENAVKRSGGIPPYPSTQKYVNRVAMLFERYKSIARNKS